MGSFSIQCGLSLFKSVSGLDTFFRTMADESVESDHNEEKLYLHPPSGLMVDQMPDLPQADKILAESLNDLSLEEREKVYEDIHGISDSIKETPELLEKALLDLDVELSIIKEKAAYEKALKASTDYVTDVSFRIRFLRADLYDSKKAASRMVRYFETKSELFGDERLALPIRLADLTDLEVAFLKRGSFQVLHSRDTKGRAVVVSMTAHHSFPRPEIVDPAIMVQKVFWYAMGTLVEDEETQKNGVVFIIYGIGSKMQANEMSRKIWWGCSRITMTLPLYLTSVHYCNNKSIVGPQVPFVALSVGPEVRARMRTHQGEFGRHEVKLTYSSGLTWLYS